MRTIHAVFLFLAVSILACGSTITPAQHASFDLVKCEVKALEPLAFSDADAIVSALNDGRLTLDDAAAIAAAAKDTEAAVKAAFAACKAKASASASADAGAP